MAVNRKKIESFIVKFRTEGDYNFETLITCTEVAEREIRVKQKGVSLKILKNGRRFIIGLVETSRDNNIPPKKNRKKRTISKLGLDDGEGLAYANVFIYEKRRGILMYEVNKFGCFVDHFVEYVYKSCKRSERFTAFDITLEPILNANEYRRLMDMRFYKSITIQVANPQDIIDSYRHRNDALFNVCSSAVNLDSKKVNFTFEVSARGNQRGLTPNRLTRTVNNVLEVVRGPLGNNVEKFEVKGYETDSDDNRLQTIDLIADRYLKYIELNEPRENSDLLEGQREHEIKRLYERCLPDFDIMFGASS